MNNAQKNLVKKVAVKFFLVILIVIVSSILSKSLSDAWLSTHRETLTWSALVLFIIVSAFAKNKQPMPTYSERHQEFNRLFDENPWAKIYVVVFVIIIAIGLFYISSKHIDMGAVLDKVGFFGFVAVIVLLMLPIFIIKLKESYDEAGEND
jgi:uncharacterized membrane protein